jgi:hypothetical protein
MTIVAGKLSLQLLQRLQSMHPTDCPSPWFTIWATDPGSKLAIYSLGWITGQRGTKDEGRVNGVLRVKGENIQEITIRCVTTNMSNKCLVLKLPLNPLRP